MRHSRSASTSCWGFVYIPALVLPVTCQIYSIKNLNRVQFMCKQLLKRHNAFKGKWYLTTSYGEQLGAQWLMESPFVCMSKHIIAIPYKRLIPYMLKQVAIYFKSD